MRANARAIRLVYNMIKESSANNISKKNIDSTN